MGVLKTEGLVAHSRGQIIIMDAAGLGRASCECYGVVKEDYDRLVA